METEEEETVDGPKQAYAIVSDHQSNTTYINSNNSLISPRPLQKGNSYNYLSVEDSTTNQTNINPVKKGSREPQTSTRNGHQKNCTSLPNKFIQFSCSDKQEQVAHVQSQESCQHEASLIQYYEQNDACQSQAQEQQRAVSSNRDNKVSSRSQYRSQSQANGSAVVVIDMSNGLSPPREDQKGIARST